MRVIPDVRSTMEQYPRMVLTVGCFDGVHLGHQQILNALVEQSRAIDGTPAVMTLEPHPRRYFAPENAPNILTPNSMKYRLLEKHGVEALYILPFDEETANMSPQNFVETMLVAKCQATMVIVGHDFAFGHNAAGDYEYLNTAGKHYGFETRQIPPLIIGGQRVSSTLLRERVIQGEVEHLDQFLGRPFSLCGRVVPGRGIGRVLGFPTANLDIGDCVAPAHGVYAAKAVVEGVARVAAVNIGIAPTMRDTHPLVEAHLLDFAGALGDVEMELFLYKRLRPEKKFVSRDALIAAIAADVQYIRNYFGV